MIDRIQVQLESIYGLRCEYRASDFLVDAEQARALGGTGRAREELLVAGGAEDLELALYLEPELIDRMGRFGDDAGAAMSSSLGDFCELAEGVSHFVYLAHTAAQERTVSLLELEAQAEVDKFALCTLLHWGGDVRRWSGGLLRRLFDRVGFRETLDGAETWRYQQANRVARAYCDRLLGLVGRGSVERLLTELRHGYRMGAEAKLAYFSKVR